MIRFACAKINIGLNIKNKRLDGYHEIETVFFPINVNDVVEIVVSMEDKIFLKNYGINIQVDIFENLCYKAWRILKELYDLPYVKMFLYKSIPIGAGLGGGSSDAASTLILLNNLFKLNLSEIELKKYALQLGSDCPFFINPQISYATGRGELLEPLNINIDFSSFFIVIVYPNISISTAKAYSMAKKFNPDVYLKDLILNKPLTEWRYYIKNDFEDILSNDYSFIKEIKNKLYANGAVYASLSGSGSCIYGIFDKGVIPSDIYKAFNSYNVLISNFI